MELTITKHQLLNVNTSLDYLANKETSVWYEIGRNKKRIKSEIEELTETELEMQKKLADKDDAGEVKISEDNQITFSEENGKEYAEKWSYLLKEEVIIDFFQFPLQRLADQALSPAAIEALMDIVLTDGEAVNEVK